MSTHYKTQAFVFKKNDINESDRIFSVFTDEFGRLDIFGKAIRKNASKLRGGIDTFSLSEIEFIQGKSKKILIDAVIVERYGDVLRDLEKFKIVSRIGEILHDFIKGEEKDKDVFFLVKEVMDKINSQKFQKRILNRTRPLIFYYFLWNFFSMQGYRSEVQKCAGCQKKLSPYNIYFSIKEGGVICRECLCRDESAQKINSDIVKILRLVFLKDWDILSKLKVEPSSQKLLSDISENAIHAFCPAQC